MCSASCLMPFLWDHPLYIFFLYMYMYIAHTCSTDINVVHVCLAQLLSCLVIAADLSQKFILTICLALKFPLWFATCLYTSAVCSWLICTLYSRCWMLGTCMLSLSSQNTSSGDRSYTVAGIWETGVPFLAPLNEETPKGKPLTFQHKNINCVPGKYMYRG